MIDWFKANLIGILTLLLVGVGGIYAYGQLNQQVQELERLERRLEVKIDSLTDRVSRIEGYLHANRNGYNLTLVDTPAPVALPRPVPEPEMVK